MILSKVYEWLIFNLFQPECPLCRLAAGGDGQTLGSGLCPGCAHDIPRLTGHLCRCGLPLSSAVATSDERPPLCGRCLRHPPPFDRVVAPLVYDFPLDRLVLGYKQQRRLQLERPLLHLWRQSLRGLPAPRPDLLVPVPLHWRRLWWRGFNPALQLALAAGEEFGVPVQHSLVRQRATPSQQYLTAAARRRNLHRAIRAHPLPPGLHVALVDDVVTTGSTARAASEALLQAGACRVDVWALARTLPAP